jgi:hypothetical protein
MALPLTPPSGPGYQLAMFCFLYMAFLCDTLFIRLFVIIGVSLMLVWQISGVPAWPYVWNVELEGLPIDAIIWTTLICIANGIPAFRQLYYNDANVRFGGPYEDEAEATWRDWFRRSGITRADFKMIIQAAEWIELSPNASLPQSVHDEPENSSGDSSASAKEDEYYYYCVDGRVELAWELAIRGAPVDAEGTVLGSGDFLNGLSLLAFFGQAHVGMALRENASVHARVTADSSFISSDESSKGEAGNSHDTIRDGALLLRWSKGALISQVLDHPCDAAAAMRLCVNQNCLHTIYREALPSGMRPRFQKACEMRRHHNRTPLPRDAAAQKRPLLKQWLMSHVSYRSVLKPSPFERAINALTVGSQEWEQMGKLRSSDQLAERAEQTIEV